MKTFLSRRARRSSSPLASDCFEPLEPRQVFSGEVLGSADAAGTLTAISRNDAGTITVLQAAVRGSVSRYDNFGVELGAPTPTSTPLSWADPIDGHTYAAAPSAEGVLVYKQYASGTWGFNRATQSLGAPALSNLTQFTGLDGSVTIAGIQSNGDFAAITKAPGGAWSYKNLSDDLRAEGLQTPVIVGKLVSYVTGWDGRNIAGLDADGNIQSVWWSPGVANNHWRADNLSAITGAAPLVGSLAPFVTSWGAVNVAGTDANGHARITWWVPGGEWRTSDLTDLVSGPSLDSSSLSSYVTPWGGTNLVGRDSSGTMTVYWWAPGLNTWVVSADLVPGAPALAGPITGIASPTGAITLVSTNEDGHIARYHWTPGEPGWSYQDVTAAATPVGQDQSTDFFTLTGLDQVGASRTYNVEQFDTAISTTATATITRQPNKFLRWTLRSSDPDFEQLALTSNLSIQRRADGAYLDLSNPPTAALEKLNGLGLIGSSLKIAPSSPLTAFSSSTPVEASLPKDWTGHASGTATSTIASLGAHYIQLGSGAVFGTQLEWNFVFELSGTVDMHDGQGPQSRHISAQSHMYLYCVPGLGIINIAQTTSGENSSSDGFSPIEVRGGNAQLTSPKIGD